MWLLALPFQRQSTRPSPRMLFGEPALEHLSLGLGSVVADGCHMPCQHSAFALPRAVTPAPLVRADPLEATGPLQNADELDGAVVLIRRGECSFEDKLRRASECNAAAVILIDDQPASDALFVARPDGPSPPTPSGTTAPAYCPLVTVSAASGEALLAAAGATCEVLPFSVERVEWEERGELLQVPLFPLERPLLPGSRRELKLSASERYELLASCGGRDEGGLVAVCFADPLTKQVGTIATLGLVAQITKGCVTLEGNVQREGSAIVRPARPKLPQAQRLYPRPNAFAPGPTPLPQAQRLCPRPTAALAHCSVTCVCSTLTGPGAGYGAVPDGGSAAPQQRGHVRCGTRGAARLGRQRRRRRRRQRRRQR